MSGKKSFHSSLKGKRDIDARLSRLEAEYVAGKYDGEGQEKSYFRMHGLVAKKKATLSERIDQLPIAELISVVHSSSNTISGFWFGSPRRERSFLT